MVKKVLPPQETGQSSPEQRQTQLRPQIPIHPVVQTSLTITWRLGQYGIFWLWNLSFILLLYAFVLPVVGLDLWRAVLNGEIAAEMLLTLVGLMLVPTVCSIAGAWLLLRSPDRLMKLFVGVEAPLMLLLGVRLGVLRELTDASYFLFGTFLLCIGAFALSLWQPQWGKSRRWLGWLQGSVHALMWIVGLHVSLFILVYVIPSGALVIEAIAAGYWLDSLYWQDSLYYIIQELLFFTLFSLSIAFFLAMPFLFGWLYCRTAQQAYRNLGRWQGRAVTLVVTTATLMAWFVIFGGVNRQPQQAVFAQLENATTPAAQAALLQDDATVRQGLLNAYLQSYRYIGLNHESRAVKDLYNYALDIPRDRLTGVQEFHDWLISPFLYRGERGDSEKAAEQYAAIFDQPIQKAEQDGILKALKSTTMLDAANAGVLNIGEQKVWVARQELNVTPQENWVDVELYEVYQNQTHDVEEIFYSFTLPPNAVLTGIWLNETSDRATRYPFQVSPRGAAQKVYNSQVQRARPVDPALLEQVGPNQYRLRAFPIPAKLSHWEQGENRTDRPTEMHLWLTYRAVPSESDWRLPGLTEARNVYWTKDTERIRNGEAVPGFENWFEDTMAFIPQAEQLPIVSLAGYDLTPTAIDSQAPPRLDGKEIALLLDTSYSMGTHREALQAELDWLSEQGLLDGDRANGEVTLYTLAAGETKPQKVAQPNSFSAKDPLFYGVVHLKDMVQSWATVSESSKYDALILFSDEGNYELVKDDFVAPANPNPDLATSRRDDRTIDPSESPVSNFVTPEDKAKNTLPELNVPLWTVHLGYFPAAYDDATLKLIQDSQGGVARSLVSALGQWSQRAKLAPNQLLSGSWQWQITPNPDATATTTGLEPIAARLLIGYLSQNLDAADPVALDQLHAIAKEQAIVTPYSSMIVLVNDEQRQALKEAEESSDRFNRTIEDGDEQLQEPPGVLGQTTIPEPGVWLGTVVATGFFWLNRRRRSR